MAEDPVGFDFSWDEKRFMEILWPELAEFVPAFDTLKLVRGWAGLYAVNTLDGNAILGAVDLDSVYRSDGDPRSFRPLSRGHQPDPLHPSQHHRNP